MDTNEMIILKEQILNFEILKECFMLRLKYVNENKANKSEFELNEALISEIKTKIDILSIDSKIKEKRKLFFENVKEVLTDMQMKNKNNEE